MTEWKKHKLGDTNNMYTKTAFHIHDSIDVYTKTPNHIHVNHHIYKLKNKYTYYL